MRPLSAPPPVFCWASQEKGFLVAQLVTNLPAMRETWVQSLGQEDHLEEGMATHSSIPAWRIHGQRSLGATVRGVA